MYSKTTVIKSATGLHARPASDFITAASKFKSKIVIRKDEDGSEANAKSIVMLLSLALGQNESVTITANGEDEIDAVDALVSMIENDFNV